MKKILGHYIINEIEKKAIILAMQKDRPDYRYWEDKVHHSYASNV